MFVDDFFGFEPEPSLSFGTLMIDEAPAAPADDQPVWMFLPDRGSPTGYTRRDVRPARPARPAIGFRFGAAGLREE